MSGWQTRPIPIFIIRKNRRSVSLQLNDWKTEMMTREMVLTMMVVAVKGRETRQVTKQLDFLSLYPWIPNSVNEKDKQIAGKNRGSERNNFNND